MDDMVGCSMVSESLGLIGYRALEGEFGRAVADDRTGAQGYIQQVYCAEGSRVFYVEGAQQGVFQARGRGVVIVSFTETAPDTIANYRASQATRGNEADTTQPGILDDRCAEC